jgi:hypothetical protein
MMRTGKIKKSPQKQTSLNLHRSVNVSLHNPKTLPTHPCSTLSRKSPFRSSLDMRPLLHHPNSGRMGARMLGNLCRRGRHQIIYHRGCGRRVPGVPCSHLWRLRTALMHPFRRSRTERSGVCHHPLARRTKHHAGRPPRSNLPSHLTRQWEDRFHEVKKELREDVLIT